MPRKRATKKGLISLLLCLIVGLVVASVIFGMRGIRDQTRIDLKNDLQTVLSTTQNSLNIWARETEKRTLRWANVNATIVEVKSQLNLLESVNKSSMRSALFKSKANRRLFDVLGPTAKSNGYLGYFIMDPNGWILSASYDSLIGRNTRSLVAASPVSGDTQNVSNVLNLGQREPVIIPPFRQNGNLIPNHPVISVALAPVLSNGNAIAYLGFFLDPAENLTTTTQLGRVGKTGETYAFDQAGYLVTNSRFERSLVKAGLITPGQSAILSVQIKDPEVNLVKGEKPKLSRDRQPFTEMAQSALQRRSGFNVDGYRDYRGVQVVGAWLWDPVLNLGLVTEIDADEAYRSFDITRTLVFRMLLLTVIGAAAVESGLWLQSRALIKTVDHLEKTRQMLQESIQARNEFISIAAHELRTPLTSLRLQINLIRNLTQSDAICKYPREKLVRITNVSAVEIERFSKIIRNLLYVSRASGGRLSLELEDFDLMKKVQDIRFQHLQQLERNGCSLTVRGPSSVMVRWDRSQIEQVLTNLLSNAIKFGKGKPIEIDIREAGQWIHLSVTDHGIGIKKEDQPKVFEKFERAGAINPEGGLGLGLYLVRKIIHQHHGTIDVKSESGMGSTFTLQVPKILNDNELREAKAA